MGALDLVLLAQEEPRVLDESVVSPGVLGFLVTFAVALALIVLVRSFNKQVRKVNVAFKKQEAELAELASTEGDGAGEGVGAEAVVDDGVAPADAAAARSDEDQRLL